MTSVQTSFKLIPAAPQVQVANVAVAQTTPSTWQAYTGVSGGILSEAEFEQAGTAYGLVVDGSKMYD